MLEHLASVSDHLYSLGKPPKVIQPSISRWNKSVLHVLEIFIETLLTKDLPGRPHKGQEDFCQGDTWP